MADSVDTIAAGTGLPRGALLGVWAHVKENQRKLDACSAHVFNADGEGLFKKYTCANCGGTADGHAVHWYKVGIAHERARAG